MDKKVKKDDLISDTIENFPEASIVMLEYGLNCATCHANKFETIEVGARVHAMSDKEINVMVKKINILINKKF